VTFPVLFLNAFFSWAHAVTQFNSLCLKRRDFTEWFAFWVSRQLPLFFSGSELPKTVRKDRG